MGGVVWTDGVVWGTKFTAEASKCTVTKGTLEPWEEKSCQTSVFWNPDE